MNDIRLRPAAPVDAAGLGELHRSSLRGVAAAHYSPEQVEAFIVHARAHLADWLNTIRLWVALDRGTLVASAGWLLDSPKVATIRSVFVHSGWTRRGLAARLLDRVETEAWDAGARRFDVQAMHGSEPFYLARGYAAGDEVVFDFAGVRFPGRAMSKPAAPSGPRLLSEGSLS